jgi:S-DNA-T family DNA segregation ATPase FtsK/SpoIIIE
MNIIARITSVIVLIGCIFSIISILDYHPDDPSYIHLTEKEPSNAMAKYGANIADPLIQAFGYSLCVVLFIVIFCAFMVILGRKQHMILLKISILIVALPAICFLISIFDASEISDGDYYNFHYAGYLGYFLYSEAYYSDKFALYTSLATCISLFSITFSVGLLEKIANLLAKISFNSKITTIIGRRKQSSDEPKRHNIVKDNPEIKFKIQENSIFNNKSFDIASINKADVKQKEDGLFKVENLEKNHSNFNIESKTRSEGFLSHFPGISKDEKEMVDIFKPQTDLIPQNKQSMTEKSFVAPETSILSRTDQSFNSSTREEDIKEQSNLLLKVLNDFGIRGEITEVFHGPVVTLYCFEPVSGTKSSRVIGLSDDIARSMRAKSARISIVKGTNALGIELPNEHRQTITLREILESEQYKNKDIQLPIALGKNITGETIVADLAKMPHLLVAGTTGSGKSVSIHSMILSLIFRYGPDQCKFIMIDPKMLELSVYSSISHLLAPVVTTPEKAVEIINWLVNEMSSRYRAMSNLGVRNISSYNNLIREAKSRNSTIEKEVQTGFDSGTNQPIFESITIPNDIFPYIVVIIDEMADLMLTAGKEIENSVQRLAQMARAAGIHLIMATQRPSVDVITGVIKANFPTRISFQVASRFDSRTVLGEIGAEQLLGSGDMLYMMPGGKIERIHGTYVSEEEVAAVVAKVTSSQ